MKVAIIGAGASGLMLGGLLAKKGYNVTILDHNEKAGKKPEVGVVNGLAAVSTGGRNVFELVFNIDGREFYRTTLDDLRAVQKANPEVAMA